MDGVFLCVEEADDFGEFDFHFADSFFSADAEVWPWVGFDFVFVAPDVVFEPVFLFDELKCGCGAEVFEFFVIGEDGVFAEYFFVFFVVEQFFVYAVVFDVVFD